MSGSSPSSAPDDDARGLPSPEQLDAAARELNSDRLPKQAAPLPQKAASVPSIEELDAAADELRSGRLPLQRPAEERPPKPKGGLLAKPAPTAPLIEDLDAALQAEPEVSEEQPPLS